MGGLQRVLDRAPLSRVGSGVTLPHTQQLPVLQHLGFKPGTSTSAETVGILTPKQSSLSLNRAAEVSESWTVTGFRWQNTMALTELANTGEILSEKCQTRSSFDLSPLLWKTPRRLQSRSQHFWAPVSALTVTCTGTTANSEILSLGHPPSIQPT